MQEWINQTLESETLSATVLLAAFLLGLVSSVASACCSLPIFGAIVGYSGAGKRGSRRAVLLTAVFFMVGTIIALIVLGSVAGFIGQAARIGLGKYWQVFAGLIAVLFGLATLNLLPFGLLKTRTSESRAQPQGLFGAAVFGLVMGGGISAFSLCCNPGIFIVLGVIVLKGYNLWAMAILVAYAIGFSLPLGAAVLGVSFGKMAVKAKKADTAIRIVAGGLLIVAGFYLLASA